MNNELEVQSNQSDQAVSFYIIKDNKIALSELTMIGQLGADYADLIKNKADKQLFLSEIENVKKVYYFSRLNVPEKLRNQGIGRLLMDNTIEFCKQNNAMLINTVNPYGDLNLNELNEFYQKSGMKLVNKQGLLIYSPKMQYNNIQTNKIKP